MASAFIGKFRVHLSRRIATYHWHSVVLNAEPVSFGDGTSVCMHIGFGSSNLTSVSGMTRSGPSTRTAKNTLSRASFDCCCGFWFSGIS